MDGDVLYDEKILNLMIENKESCLAYDTEFEDDDEPVKVCMVKNQIQEFGKGSFPDKNSLQSRVSWLF